MNRYEHERMILADPDRAPMVEFINANGGVGADHAPIDVNDTWNWSNYAIERMARLKGWKAPGETE